MTGIKKCAICSEEYYSSCISGRDSCSGCMFPHVQIKYT